VWLALFLLQILGLFLDSEMYCPYRGIKNSRTLLRIFRHVTTKAGVQELIASGHKVSVFVGSLFLLMPPLPVISRLEAAVLHLGWLNVAM
jgi:hypothetical protein